MAGSEVLVVGATGHQGSATIAAIHASPAQQPPIRILALTRSIHSPKAQSLQTKYPDIVLVEGVTHKPEPIFAAYPSISSIFLVTVPPDEESQAVPLIDFACASTNVEHIVFSSVERGGDVASWNNPTQVPHFAAKHRIELHLRDACESAQRRVRWTILRPTGFMDNYNPGYFGSLMASLWQTGLPAGRRLQLVSTHDIGVFAAKALLDPEKWDRRALGLAGCEVSFDEAARSFRAVVVSELPTTWAVVAKGVIWWVEEARASFEWFDRVGYAADIEMLQRECPDLQDFETWLRESSAWMIQAS